MQLLHFSISGGGRAANKVMLWYSQHLVCRRNNKPNSKMCTIENTPEYLRMAIFASNTQCKKQIFSINIFLKFQHMLCDRSTAWNIGIFLQMAMGFVCWRDVSTEEMARKSPAISHITDKHFTDQICYKCIQTVLVKIPAESIKISLEYILFLPNK